MTCHKCGGVVKMQIGGTLLQPITAQDMSNVLSLLSVPQKAITKLVTGKYQTPSEAMNIKNPVGAFATDAALDPVNLLGLGLLGNTAKASTKTGILSNTYKINPFAFKPNPQAYYHRSPNLENIINREAGILQGFGQSKAGKEFTEEALKPSQGLNLRKGANSQLYFSKGVPLDFGRTNMVFDEKTGKMIPGQGYKGPYLVEVKNVPMGASTKGRAPGGEPTKIGSYAVSKRPVAIDESKFYQEDWLRGYKQIKIPNKKEGGQHGGLDRWFAEKWVDVKTGKDCGRQEGEKRAGYPACRPSKRVNSQTPKTSSEMSSAEKAKFKASKTSSQRINYNHKRNK
jgi:hypothetical protein